MSVMSSGPDGDDADDDGRLVGPSDSFGRASAAPPLAVNFGVNCRFFDRLMRIDSALASAVRLSSFAAWATLAASSSVCVALLWALRCRCDSALIINSSYRS